MPGAIAEQHDEHDEHHENDQDAADRYGSDHGSARALNTLCRLDCERPRPARTLPPPLHRRAEVIDQHTSAPYPSPHQPRPHCKHTDKQCDIGVFIITIPICYH